MKKPKQKKDTKNKVNEITCKITLSRHDMTGAVPRGGGMSAHEYQNYNKVAALSPPGENGENLNNDNRQN